MQSSKPQPIPSVPLAIGALRVLWQSKDDALRLGFIPGLVLFAAFVFGSESLARYLQLLSDNRLDEIDGALIAKVMTMLLISAAVAGLSVANWLRFLLLGPMSAVGMGLSLDRGHIGFFAATSALLLLLGMAMAVLSMPLALLPPPFGVFAMLALTLATIAVFARLIFVAVSIVIGQAITPRQSWTATQGNGLRMALALILVEMPMVLIALALESVGFADAAPYAMVFLTAILQICVLFAQAGVLAAGYRHLIGVEA